MGIILPSSLDNTSAQVLGFDADAYINDKPSTLYQRLNIPQSFCTGDYFTSDRATKSNVKKGNFWSFAASILTLAGVLSLICMGLKGKIKIPDKIAKPVLNAASNVTNFAKNTTSKIKEKFLSCFGNIVDKFKK